MVDTDPKPDSAQRLPPKPKFRCSDLQPGRAPASDGSGEGGGLACRRRRHEHHRRGSAADGTHRGDSEGEGAADVGTAQPPPDYVRRRPAVYRRRQPRRRHHATG